MPIYKKLIKQKAYYNVPGHTDGNGHDVAEMKGIY